MIKNVVFDYGKVLLDWNPHYMFDPYFEDQSKSDYLINNILTADWYNEGDIGTPMKDLVEKWSAKYPEWKDALEYYVDEFPKTIKGEIPGMYELISDLKKNGYGVYGLSNWSLETFSRVKNKFPVFGLLDGMVVSGAVHLLKPSKEIYIYLLNEYGLRGEETVFTDDMPRNVEGANAAGLHGILFKDSAQLRAELREMNLKI